MIKNDVLQNPFNPSFGRRPKIFIGRDDIKREFLSSLDYLEDPWRSTIVTGARGSGKTVLISEIVQDLPKETVKVTVTADVEFLNNVLSQLYKSLNKNDQKLLSIEGIGLNVAGIGGSVSKKEPDFLHTFRYQLETLLEKLGKERSVVFFIDEIQKHTEEMRNFVATYQNLLMEDYNIAVLMAGLPQALSNLLSDEVLTFFRRANQVELQAIDIDLVAFDYQKIFETLSIDEKVVQQAAYATEGYPYLVQLIGYYLWKNAASLSDSENLERTLIEAKANLFQNVHDIVFSDLTAKERDFVFAMAEDEKVSERSELIRRLGVTQNYFATYRARLIASGVVREAGRGMLAFVIPYMREYLQRKDKEI